MIAITRGAATACLQIATLARPDTDDASALFEALLATWQRLDEELLHPHPESFRRHVQDSNTIH